MKRNRSKPRARQIRFGGLREKVKAGKIRAEDVLTWLEKTGKIRTTSPQFIGWLRRFDLESHRERAKAEKERREKASKK